MSYPLTPITPRQSPRKRLAIGQVLLLVCAAGVAASAHAQVTANATGLAPAGDQAQSKSAIASNGPVTREIPIADGKATKAWFTLQASGEAASKLDQPLPGPAMQRSYARYLKTFEKEVPDKLRDNTSISTKK